MTRRIPFRIMIPLTVFLLLSPLPANNLVDQLIDRIVSKEQGFLDRLRQHNPILETYIQEIAYGPGHSRPPVMDHYMIGKLDTSQQVSHDGFVSAGFRKSDSTVFYPAGFAQMVIPDAPEFNRETYEFEYVRREFLGDVRSLVFDIVPKDSAATGKFRGRIWVEDREYNIVRLNGTYTMSKTEGVLVTRQGQPDVVSYETVIPRVGGSRRKALTRPGENDPRSYLRSSSFFHFDSWRINTAPGIWMPAFVYVEDAVYGPKRAKKHFKAQTRLWGYNPSRKSKFDELTAILIEAGDPVRDDSSPKHLSPVESQRIWEQQAEENIIDLLEKAGLLAAQGEVDEVLNTVVNNLIVTNEINIDAHCRVLLTTPLETFSVGQAIIISRGLLDVLPDEASLAAMLATELAHIALGHRTETMYAFSDQTMIDDTDVLSELRFVRGEEEVKAANEKALQILSNSPYAKDLSSAGLFLTALANRAATLPNLLRPNLGNGLYQEGQLLRLGELAKSAPDLDEDKIDQIAALPLGSRVKVNPWTNELSLIKTKPAVLVTPEDKMPFHITPFVLHLTRVEAGDFAVVATKGKSPQTNPPVPQSQSSRTTSPAQGGVSR